MEENPKFPFGLSRETTIRRTADGRWYHDGELVENVKLARAFDRWVCRADDGRFCLKNDINWAYITLEGAPYFVRAVRIEQDRVLLMLSNDDTVVLDPSSLREGPDGVLYCTAHPGMAARFDSHAAVQLAALLEEGDHGPQFHHGTTRTPIVRASDPLNCDRA